MHIRVFLNLGTREFGERALSQGEHRNVDDGFAEKLIARGLAEPLPERKAAAPPPPKSERADATSAPPKAAPPESRKEKP